MATAASLYGPFGVAVDASGNLYIADISNQRIRKVIPVVLSVRWLAMGVLALVEMEELPRQLVYIFPLMWQWMPRAISTSRILVTAASGRSIPAVLLPQ